VLGPLANHRYCSVDTSGKMLETENHSQMAHPMHPHGHHFQVLAPNGRPSVEAIRDTVLVLVTGLVRVAVKADNPVRWPFHCHNFYHGTTGIMTEVAYTEFA